jgi:acyl-CoA synthetase (AMP-forming)/AMP-acid ligase II/thioesterase domain-containing protein
LIMEHMSKLASGAAAVETLNGGEHPNGVKSIALEAPSVANGTNGAATVPDLATLLKLAAGSQAGTTVYTPGDGIKSMTRRSYDELISLSEKRVDDLHRATHHATDKIVLLHFDNHDLNIQWLWAVIFAGYLPAISTPLSSDPHLRTQHLLHLKKLLNDPVVLTSARLLGQFGEAAKELNVCTIETLGNAPNGTNGVNASSETAKSPRPAMLMLTSGSSGNAKAVALTTPQIMASIQGKSDSWSTSDKSVFLNWIGLDHVANLTEVHLHAMMLKAEQVHVHANDLLADPLLFLRLIDKHRVTHTFAPNFFLAMVADRLAKTDPSDSIFNIDLSCLRSIMSGGEANVVRTAESLSRRLRQLGTPGEVIRLGYGLTESCAALLYGMLDVEYEDEQRHEYASVGKPIKGALVRIGDGTGASKKTNEVGDLELSGPVVFKEYFNNPEATASSFTPDGWFCTGDRAYIDDYGKVNLAGRAKELILINGVKYAPQDLEGSVERASLPGVMPSYTAVFSYRAPGSDTEGYCTVYGATEEGDTPAMRSNNAYLISRLLSGLVGTRPDYVIGLPISQLDKSSLGKLSRAKLRATFEKGNFDAYKTKSIDAIRTHVSANRIAPNTPTEATIVQVLGEMLDLPEDAISVDSTVFEVGISSITLFRFEQNLRARLGLADTVSVITLLSNPIITAIAWAIDNHASRQYNPVVVLQQRGNKSPLWLVHPASGNVLAFLPLSRTLVDRPLYALTARGLSSNELLFGSIEEMCDTYFEHVKKTQPKGPYALTGYSLGTTVAFELAKRLEANGDEVAFCASLDSPPHVIPLVQHLDWCAAAVLVSYFIELISQPEVPGYIEQFRGLSKPEIIDKCLEVARPEQRAKLNLDREQLMAIVNVTDNFGSMAKIYHPQGNVNKIDVFYCTPLHSVEKNRELWITDHLSKWQDFSRGNIEYHECPGDHADMLNPTYVESFKQVLLPVLAARGI